MEEITIIKKLLGEGKLKIVFNLLETMTQGTSVYTENLTLQKQYKQYASDKMLGLISWEKAYLTENKLTMQTLKLCDEIENQKITVNIAPTVFQKYQ